MCSLRMLIPLHRGSTDAACGQAMDRRGRESAVRTTGLVKRLGPEWRMPSRPLVDRTRQPPANGVKQCENDADRGRVQGTGPSGNPGQRNGFGTSDGTRQRVECQRHCLRPSLRSHFIRSVAALHPFQPAQSTRHDSTTSHAVATVVTEVAVAVADRDRPAVVARRRVDLELGKLSLSVGRARRRIDGHLHTGSLQQRR